jgi:type VI secretion system secreted protein VgrG
MTRAIKLKSDLGDKLVFARLQAQEELGRLSEFRIDALCKDAKPNLGALLGTEMAVSLSMSDGYKRHFHGIVVEAAQTGFARILDHQQATCSFVLRPKAWLLTRRADSRIFKKKKVVDIVKLLLNEIGYGDIKVSTSGTYAEREYCVQYRETGFNFISRLMEQEGIYYYFEHSDSKHTMVLSDALSAHARMPGFGSLPYSPTNGTERIREGVILDWRSGYAVRSTHYGLSDYDPLKPKTKLDEVHSVDAVHKILAMELDDYAGDFEEPAVGKHYATVRVEAENVPYFRQSGSTNAVGFLTGGLFALTAHPNGDENQEYLAVSARTMLRDAATTSGSGTEESLYECHFDVIPGKRPFRSALITPRPIIAGLQTAVVMGTNTTADEDIEVDKYGRVQVAFHWKAHNVARQELSCPARVATSWAGKQWGTIHIPRIGQEVVVSFLEGNPDRPLIIGSVYNADNMPPYALPANMTQSGIKSRSHKGGGAAHFNEFRFEDKKGSEEVYLHAEKNLKEMVENDHLVDIGNDEIENIKGNRTHTIDKDEKFEIKQNRTHKVGQEDKLDVGANATTSVKQKYKLTAGTEIELVTGASSIKMTAAGDITIKGVNVTIEASMALKAEGKMTVDIKAGIAMNLKAGVQLNAKSDVMAEFAGGAMATVKAPILMLTGDGMAKLAGGITMIG